MSDKTRGVPDDSQVRIGNWIVQVTRDTAYLHHVNHPGDISVQAKMEQFVVEVRNDDADTVRSRLSVPYEGLGPMMGTA